jgi:hypothetical protein
MEIFYGTCRRREQDDVLADNIMQISSGRSGFSTIAPLGSPLLISMIKSIQILLLYRHASVPSSTFILSYPWSSRCQRAFRNQCCAHGIAYRTLGPCTIAPECTCSCNTLRQSRFQPGADNDLLVLSIGPPTINREHSCRCLISDITDQSAPIDLT